MHSGLLFPDTRPITGFCRTVIKYETRVGFPVRVHPYFENTVVYMSAEFVVLRFAYQDKGVPGVISVYCTVGLDGVKASHYTLFPIITFPVCLEAGVILRKKRENLYRKFIKKLLK